MSPGPWRAALVTGASSGIGEAFTRALAGRGVDVVMVARRVERLERLRRELQSATSVSVEVIGADLGEPDSLAAVEARLADADRPVDLLVNNAGFGTSGTFAELPVDREEEEIRVNVLALVRLTHAALPGMIERGRGAICNVSSVASFAPAPGNATYAATKAFVTSFSQAVHEEVRGTGVTVTAVCPGLTRTEFQATADYSTSRVPALAWMDADDVVREGLVAVEAGRALCTPGVLYKTLAVGAHLLPRPALRRIATLFRD